MLNMNTKLRSLLGSGVKSYIGAKVGVELEYEGAHHALYGKKMRDWSLVQDHSLRNNGIEFVSRVLPKMEVRRALELADNVIKAEGLYTNKRCGVHVHVNCTDLPMNQVWSFILLYSLLEPHIFKRFADGREENHFCVPVMWNTNFVECMKTSATTLFKGISPPRLKKSRASTIQVEAFTFDQAIQAGLGAPATSRSTHIDLPIYHSSKYSAVNTTALKRFGTLEFRHLGGTTDIDEVYEWINFLLLLRKEARGYDDPSEIINDYIENGVECFLEFFGLPNARLTEEEEYDIVDNAFIMCGTRPTEWQSLDWALSS